MWEGRRKEEGVESRYGLTQNNSNAGTRDEIATNTQPTQQQQQQQQQQQHKNTVKSRAEEEVRKGARARRIEFAKRAHGRTGSKEDMRLNKERINTATKKYDKKR